MKIFERLILQHLKPLVCDSMDPLQFAYQENIGVEDAIIYMLHRAYTQLEAGQLTKNSVLRLLQRLQHDPATPAG